MGDKLEERINVLERNQVEFMREIREIKQQMDKIMKMVGDHMSVDQYRVKEPGQSSAEYTGMNLPQNCTEVSKGLDNCQNLSKVIQGLDELTRQVKEIKRMKKSSNSAQVPQPIVPTIPDFQPIGPRFFPPRAYPRPSLCPNSSPYLQTVPSQAAFQVPINKPSHFIQSPTNSITHNPYPSRPTQPYIQENNFPQSIFRPSVPVSTQSKSNQKQPKGKKTKEIDPLPLSYRELFPILVQNHLVACLPSKPLQPPYPKWYNPNLTCEYHSTNTGHSIEDCWAFKYKVQALIEAGWFDPTTMTCKELGKDK